MAYVRALGSGKDRRRMPSADVPSAERSNGDKLSASTSRCRLNSIISPLELIDSTTECRALCMEKHGMPVRPIMAMAACAVLVTQGRAPAGGRLGTPRATGTESQNSKHAVARALTARISWARSRRTVPIFALSERVPQKGGRLNRTSPVLSTLDRATSHNLHIHTASTLRLTSRACS